MATPSELDAIVGAQISRTRQQAGMTVPDMAAALNCSVATIEHIEAGRFRPTADQLYDLATVLNCNLSQFFRVSDNAKAKVRKQLM